MQILSSQAIVNEEKNHALIPYWLIYVERSKQLVWIKFTPSGEYVKTLNESGSKKPHPARGRKIFLRSYRICLMKFFHLIYGALEHPDVAADSDFPSVMGKREAKQ